MTENDDFRYIIKKVESKANEDQMERFVSYGEIFEALGLPVDHKPELYDRGWYKCKTMTWDRYLFERYKEEHPDDPNIKHHEYWDPDEPVKFDWHNGFEF